MAQENTKNDNFRREALPFLDPLWQTALWLTGNEPDAERLVEDAFIEAFRVWDESVSGANCKLLMFKIMIGKFLSRGKLSFQFPVPIKIDDNFFTFPIDKISNIQSIPGEIISKAIKRLTPENRLVFILSVFEKFTYPEIAEIIGVRRKIVRLRIYQGYTLIRKEILDYITAGSMSMSVV